MGGSMFLDYFALGVLFFVIVVIFYGVIAIHDIPYEIAKKAQSSPAGCIAYCGMGEFIYLTCHLALFVDLGDLVSRGSGLGI